MRHVRAFYHSFLENGVFRFCKAGFCKTSFLKIRFLKTHFSFDIFSQNFSKKCSRYISQAQSSVFFRNSLLFVCLCGVPMNGLFLKDYVNDQIEMARLQQALEKSLRSSAEQYAQFLYGLKNKILSEELYKNKESIHQLLMEVNALQAYSIATLVQSMKGLRWVSADLRAMGSYGEIRNFNSKVFLPFLRSLEQTPNIIQMININKTIYLGMGIAEGRDIAGYLLIPTSLEPINDFQNIVKLGIFQLSSRINVPFVGMTLDEFIKMPLSHIQIYKKANWQTYGFENGLAYGIFLAFSCIFLLLKRKNDTKKETELLQLEKKTSCLSQNLLAQQKAANLIIHRLHEINGSMGEISNVLLETYSSSTVFTEQVSSPRKRVQF